MIVLTDKTKTKEPNNNFCLRLKISFNGLDPFRLLLIIIKLTRYSGRQRHCLSLLVLNAIKASRSKQFRDCVNASNIRENN